MMKKINLVFAALTLTIGASHIQAKVSEEAAAKLGNELTPLGGDKSGNADGSIPPWTGGITSPPEGYQPGDNERVGRRF
jgi:hypothetical protein